MKGMVLGEIVIIKPQVCLTQTGPLMNRTYKSATQRTVIVVVSLDPSFAI